MRALAMTSRSSGGLLPKGVGLKTWHTKDALSAKEISAYKDLFNTMDSNKDGFLTKEDLRKGLKEHINYAASEKELDDTMNTLDSDKDGSVGLDEFLDYVAWSKQMRTEDAIKYAFQTFDTDNDGLINKEELKEALVSLGYLPNDLVIKQIMLKSDKKSDGSLTLDEFRKIFYEGESSESQ